MVLAEERRQVIFEMLERDGSLRNETLQQRLGVSRMTLWRELKHLEEQGLLRRVRGGAVRVDATPEPRFEAKESASLALKKRIARYAAGRFIQPGQTLFLEGGTTIAELIPFLPRNVRIMTNSLRILTRLHIAGRSLDVFSSGGAVSPISGNMVGQRAIEFFLQSRADFFFMSATGLHAARGVTDPNPLEIEVKRAMASRAGRAILLLHSHKLGRVSLHEVLPFQRIHEIITDDETPPAASVSPWAGIPTPVTLVRRDCAADAPAP